MQIHIIVILKQFAQVIKVIKIMHRLSVNYTRKQAFSWKRVSAKRRQNASSLLAPFFTWSKHVSAQGNAFDADKPDELLRDSQERCGRIILHWYFYIPFLLIMTQCKAKLHHFSCLSVIEVASGEYGENVIPSLVKAWKAREESIAKKNSLTSNTSSNMVVSMLPNCNVKTSTDSIIHAASQTTQVSVMAAEWKFKRLANNLTFASILFCGLIRSMAVPA